MLTDNKKEAWVIIALANILYGIMPIYWGLTQNATSYEIMTHKTVWQLVFYSICALFSANIRKGIKNIYMDKRLALTLLGASIMIALNSLLYFYAIKGGKVIDASIGNYLTPLFQVILGIIVFKEKLSKSSLIASLVALSAIIYLTVTNRVIPYIALALGITLAFYGLFKKQVKTNPFSALFVEGLYLFPLFTAYIVYTIATRTSAFTSNTTDMVLLLASGVVTTLPMLLYSYAAPRVSMMTLGFSQYLTPTFIFISGLLFFKEALNTNKLISFILIWAALAIYSIGTAVENRKKGETQKLAAKDN